MKLVITIFCQLILISSFAQFRLHTKWVNNLTVSSGPDQGMPRIASELIFATPEANTLKMIEPFSGIARPTKPIRFDMENGVHVNNISDFDLKVFDPARNRYVIAAPSFRVADFSKNGRRYGKAYRYYFAFYKHPFDSTKLSVVEKFSEVIWTIDNKMPQVHYSGADLNQFDKHAIFRDSVVFNAAAGTNTGNNVKSVNGLIAKFQPQQSIKITEAIAKRNESWFEEILKPNEEDRLNPYRTSTSFRLMITMIENLRIDNGDEVGFKNLNTSMINKGEYYGTLNATVKHQSSVISNLTFFDSPIKTSDDTYAHFTYWGPNEKRTVTNVSSIFTIPRANFETSKLFIIGGLYEGNLVPAKSGNYSTQNNFAIISSTDNSRNIFLKDLKSGANSYIISKNGVDYWKIYFDIIAIN